MKVPDLQLDAMDKKIEASDRPTKIEVPDETLKTLEVKLGVPEVNLEVPLPDVKKNNNLAPVQQE